MTSDADNGVSDAEIKAAEDALADLATLHSPLDEWEFSVRAANVLQHHGIKTAADLVERSAADLLTMRGIGRKVVKEIRELLAEKGLQLRPSAPAVDTPDSPLVPRCSACGHYCHYCKMRLKRYEVAMRNAVKP